MVADASLLFVEVLKNPANSEDEKNTSMLFSSNQLGEMRLVEKKKIFEFFDID